VHDGRVAGVIDWTDARVGDPALDLAWPLHGAPEPFAAALSETYGVDEALLRRAHVYHALGPWHEVVHADEPRAFAGGLARVRERLAKVTGRTDTMGP
jgi:aminoglycoside phosphotransferase (APT) family kinase protein